MAVNLRGRVVGARGGMAALVALVLAVTLGCDHASELSPAAGASQNTAPSPSMAPSANPSPVPTAGWRSHSDSALRVGFLYPPTWFVQPSSTATTFSLSNEDAGAPLQMDANGIWLNVVVQRQDCSVQRISGTIVSKRSTTNSGYAGTRYVADVTDQGKFSIFWLAQRDADCAVAAFLSYSRPTRDAQLGVADALIDSITLT